MSKFHSNCCPSVNDHKRQCKGRAEPPLTSKPFCDCETCACKHCPDILKLLSITVTENSCRFGCKEAGGTTDDCSYDREHQRISDVPDNGKSCSCDALARAVRSHVHINIGMTQKRDELNEQSSTKDTPRK